MQNVITHLSLKLNKNDLDYFRWQVGKQPPDEEARQGLPGIARFTRAEVETQWGIPPRQIRGRPRKAGQACPILRLCSG